MHRFSVSFVAFLCFFISSIAFSQDQVPGEIIVKLKERTFDRSVRLLVVSALEKRLGSKAVLKLSPFKTDASLLKVKLAKHPNLQKAIDVLKAEPLIEFAEPNLIYRTQVNVPPNDPEFAKLWGLRNTGQTDSAGQVGKPGADINIVPIWERGDVGSENVLVAVIDTGVDWDHPDLAANIYTNPGEAGDKAANGVDDDGNGFIDDVHGWNFAAKSNNSRDDHDHGTHVAGTIGAIGDNGIGVAGVNWKTAILPVKFLTAGGSGSLEDAVESINYARLMKAKVLSNSWGGGGYSETLKLAIEAARDEGILFVAAAGNDRTDNDALPSYPASYAIENVLSVAAADNKDQLAKFSNYGAKTVHVAAPGVKIWSTIKGGKYDTMSGTSMATPHVSGIAALLWSLNPEMSFADVKTRLIRTSTPVTDLRRKSVSRGRVNVYQAVMNIIPPSDDPDESLWKDVERVVESPHPYAVNQDLVYPISYPGAKFIRVYFEKVQVERRYDKVFVEDTNGAVLEELTGFAEKYTSEYARGDALRVRLKSDYTVTDYGFKITKIQVITE